MIIQCEQCRTKFKLDDEKVSERGVRVRCARCRHVFTVKKPEPEFVEQPVLPIEETPAYAGGDETVLMTAPPLPPAEVAPSFAEEPSVDFSFDAPPDISADAQETVFNIGQTDAEAAAPQMDTFDFGEVSFAEPSGDTQLSEPQPWGDETVVMAPPKEPESIPVSDFDFGYAEPQSQPEPVMSGGFDFGTIVPQAEEVETAAPGIAFDFGDAVATAAPAQTPDFDFTSKPKAVVAAPESGADVDFGSFDFGDVAVAKPDDSFAFDNSEIANIPAAAQSSVAAAPADDFAFSFDDVQPQQASAPVGGDDFGFSFDEAQTTQPAEGGGMGFSFDDASAQETTNQPDAGFDFSRVDFGSADSGVTSAAAQPVEDFSIGEIDFGMDVAAVSVQEASVDKDSAALFTLGDKPASTIDGLQNAAALSSPLTQNAQEFTFEPAAQHHEEASPLSIASRRRESSTLTVVAGLVIVLILAVLGYVGFQMTGADKSGGMFSKAAPAEDGKITVQNLNAYFLPRTTAGELLVINGEAVNNFKKSRAALQLKGMLFAQGNNNAIVSKTVFAGNQLTHEQIVTMSAEKIEAAMNNQFGDSLSNLEVQPGKPIPFTIVIINPPANAKEYSVEAVGSTVAAAGK